MIMITSNDDRQKTTATKSSYTKRENPMKWDETNDYYDDYSTISIGILSAEFADDDVDDGESA